jgi:hypothetical protein
MSLLIELPKRIEDTLRSRAAKQGVSIESYISQLLAEIDTDSPEELTEDELLQRIQLNVDPIDVEEYHHLATLFRVNQLSNEEYEKLLHLNDKIELAHAERLKYIAALAKLRDQPFEDAMRQLGIKRKVA